MSAQLAAQAFAPADPFESQLAAHAWLARCNCQPSFYLRRAALATKKMLLRKKCRDPQALEPKRYKVPKWIARQG
jgi:hypothetical protein